jgi:hypothetical protein
MDEGRDVSEAVAGLLGIEIVKVPATVEDGVGDHVVQKAVVAEVDLLGDTAGNRHQTLCDVIRHSWERLIVGLCGPMSGGPNGKGCSEGLVVDVGLLGHTVCMWGIYIRQEGGKVSMDGRIEEKRYFFDGGWRD